MATFQSFSIPAALPAAELVSQNPGSMQGFQGITTFEEISWGAREKKNQQWESLKPLIREIYIKQDKPFPYLASILREEHGFVVTKRQFSRKIEQWGFRKNVGRSELFAIMRSLPKDIDEPVERRDARIKEGKLRNWRKRYGKEVAGVSMALPERDQAIDDVPHGYTGSVEVQTSQALDHQECQEMAVASFSHEPVDVCPEVSEPASDPMEVCQDSWPFDWSTVNVPGSPGLSRLFQGLKIECANPVPPMSLDASEHAEDPSCLSNSEIGDLFNESNRESNKELARICSSKLTYILSISTSIRQPAYPYRDIDNVFCGYSPSPLNEIYVFPPSPPQSTTRKSVDSGLDLMTTREFQEIELETRLGKLEKSFPTDHPSVLAVMDKLSWVYLGLGRARKAEYMSRKLVDLYRQTLGPNNRNTLFACKSLIDSIILQLRFAEAQSLICNLRYEVFNLLQPHDELFFDISYQEAFVAKQLHREVDAERLCRENLQMNLMYHGPRNYQTVRTMTQLGDITTQRGKEEGETLLRTAVQPTLESPAQSNTIQNCGAMDRLAYTLLQKGALEESRDAACKAMELFSPLLGARNMSVFGLQATLAWTLNGLERLDESERLFRTIVPLLPARGVKSDNSIANEVTILNVWYGLDHTILQKGNIEEATDCFEESFELSLSISGANDSRTNCCNWFGYCYEKKGRYDDALKLYCRMVGEIRKLGNDQDEAIAELKWKISGIEEWIARSSDMEHNDDSQYESESYYSEDEYEEDSDLRLDDDCGDNAEETTEGTGDEEEDWKVFINED